MLKRIMRLGLLLVGLSFVGLAQAEVVVDVTQIAGKSQKQVAAYLGKPKRCEQIKYGKKCYYKKAQTEVVFINHQADWITVNDMQDAPFALTTIRALGLRFEMPDFTNRHVIRWKNIQGLLSVALNPAGPVGEQTVFFAYIKAFTP